MVMFLTHRQILEVLESTGQLDLEIICHQVGFFVTKAGKGKSSAEGTGPNLCENQGRNPHEFHAKL